MISAIIVYGTLSGVVIYSLLYLLRPSWRESVEQPKHVFNNNWKRMINNKTMTGE